jgi:hypothetical protein
MGTTVDLLPLMEATKTKGTTPLRWEHPLPIIINRLPLATCPRTDSREMCPLMVQPLVRSHRDAIDRRPTRVEELTLAQCDHLRVSRHMDRRCKEAMVPRDHSSSTPNVSNPSHLSSAASASADTFAGTGRRKALLIGINYFNTSAALRGCINDAQNVQKFLIGQSS